MIAPLVFLSIFVLVFLSIFSVTASYITISINAFTFAPWVPSRMKDLKRALSLAGLEPGEIFYDLGCGDGRTVFFANKFFKAKAIGIERSWLLYLFCRLKKAIFYRHADITFHRRNLFKENLAAADVVYVYGLPHVLRNKVKAKLSRELKKGARVISYVFPIDGLTPTIADQATSRRYPVFIYWF